jgi:hypothetical protein
VAADPLDAERVNVYERWTDRAALHALRGEGPDDGLAALIVSADVDEFAVLPSRQRERSAGRIPSSDAMTNLQVGRTLQDVAVRSPAVGAHPPRAARS